MSEPNEIVIPENWKEALPEDMRANPVIEQTKDFTSLAKQLIDSQHMLGSSISIPGKDAGDEARAKFRERLGEVPGVVFMPDDTGTDEDWGKLFNRIGRPEKAADYKVEPFEGDPLVDNLKEMMHGLGLSQKQFEMFYERRKKELGEFTEAKAAARQAATEALKTVYAEDQIPTLLERGKAMVDMLGIDGLKDTLSEAGLYDHPHMLALMARIADLVDEEALPEITGIKRGGGAPAVEDAKKQLSEIMGNPEHAYWNSRHPEHREAVDRVQRLNKAIYA